MAEDSIEVQGELDAINQPSSLMQKLTSRKFLFSFAAFLMSLGTGITGLAQGNTRLATVGGICCVVSSAIYSACEAWVDANRELANGSHTQITVNGSDEDIQVEG